MLSLVLSTVSIALCGGVGGRTAKVARLHVPAVPSMIVVNMLAVEEEAERVHSLLIEYFPETPVEKRSVEGKRSRQSKHFESVRHVTQYCSDYFLR